MNDRLEGSEYEKKMPELPPLEKDAKPARKRRSRTKIEEVWIVRRQGEQLSEGWAFLTEDAAREVFNTAAKIGSGEGLQLAAVPVWKP